MLRLTLAVALAAALIGPSNAAAAQPEPEPKRPAGGRPHDGAPRTWESEALRMRLVVPSGWLISSAPPYPGQILLLRYWPRDVPQALAEIFVAREPTGGASLEQVVAKNRAALERLGFQVQGPSARRTAHGPGLELALVSPGGRHRFRQHYLVRGDYAVILSFGQPTSADERLRAALDQVLRTLVFTDGGQAR